MNQSPFWPLVWKEYRTGRAFWLAMAVMGILAQAGVAWAHPPADRNWWLYGIALMISAGFAVGIGGTLFAVEHEEKTFALLRMMPVRARELGSAKVLCAVAGLLSLLVALWFTAAALAGWQTLAPGDVGRLWGLWGLACGEGLAWGILCSLVIRSPLRATVAAVLSVTLTMQAAVTLTRTHNLAEISSYVEAIPLRLLLLALVVAADVWLLPRWLAGQFPRAPRRAAASSVVRTNRLKTRARRWNESRRMVAHLVWQSWRAGRKNIVLLVIAAPLLMLVFSMFYFGAISFSVESFSGELSKMRIFLLLFVQLSALVGVLVFHADQLQGPRFLAERGVPARTIWMSRQLAWGSWLVVLAAMLWVLPMVPIVLTWIRPYETMGPFNPWAYRNFLETYHQWQTRNGWLLWEMIFSAYAAGQFASLLVRRRLLAAILAIALGTLVASWAWLMSILGVPAVLSVLPLPLAMLLATWLRAPAWLLERSAWRSWIAPIATVLAPAALLAIVVSHYRVAQIPALNGPFWKGGLFSISPPSPEAIAEARATFELDQRALKLYIAARERFVDQDGHSRWLNQDDEVWLKPIIDLLLESSRRPANLEALPLPQRVTLTPDSALDGMLLQDAQLHQEAGELGAALESYMGLLRRDTQHEVCHNPASNRVRSNNRATLSALCNWSAAPGQTREQILAAIEELKAWHAALPPAETLLTTPYEIGELTIADPQKAIAENLIPPTAFSQASWLASRLSWERARATQLLNFLVNEQSRQVKNAERAFAENERIYSWNRIQFMSLNPWDAYLLKTTPLVQTSVLGRESLVWFVMCRETNYRATLIILALEAWKVEHGRLPDSLGDLAGSVLDTVPLDPVWAQSFLYYPAGIPSIPPPAPAAQQPFVAGHPAPAAAERLPFSAGFSRIFGFNGPVAASNWVYPNFMSGRPILWSALNQEHPEQSIDLGYDVSGTQCYYRDYQGGGGEHTNPRLALDVLEAGNAFLIPESEEARP